MRLNQNKTNSITQGIMVHFYAQKKKSIIAIALISIMIFMWIRLLRSTSAQTADASDITSKKAAKSQKEQEVQITFFELPYVEGRHNVLNRDFFQMNSDVFGAGKQQSILPAEGADETVRRVASMLRLEAIGMDTEPEAFINDRLVKVGQNIIVQDGDKKYECEVAKIGVNFVIVKVENTKVELKLKELQDFPEQ